MGPDRIAGGLGTALLAGVLAITLGACSGGSQPPADAPTQVSAPPAAAPLSPAAPGEVRGHGMVRQRDGEAPTLCLSAIGASDPPQCSGPEIVGWDWSAVDGSASRSGVTWGTYTVQGTWDGTAFTVTEPPTTADDGIPPVPAPTDEASPGLPAAELSELQKQVIGMELAGLLYLGGTGRGYLPLEVIYDDGSVQHHFDELYGDGAVRVSSALRDVDGQFSSFLLRQPLLSR